MSRLPAHVHADEAEPIRLKLLYVKHLSGSVPETARLDILPLAPLVAFHMRFLPPDASNLPARDRNP